MCTDGTEPFPCQYYYQCREGYYCDTDGMRFSTEGLLDRQIYECKKEEEEEVTCFDAETSTVCRLSAAAADPLEAYAACFGGGASVGGGGKAVAERVPMTSLISGDRVLDVGEDGALRTTTIIVNQHRDSVGEHRSTKILTLKYVGGELSLTPHHMIHLDGELQPASAARAGSVLMGARGPVKLLGVKAKEGHIINPLTHSGTLLAASTHGAPVLASVASTPDAQAALTWLRADHAWVADGMALLARSPLAPAWQTFYDVVFEYFLAPLFMAQLDADGASLLLLVPWLLVLLLLIGLFLLSMLLLAPVHALTFALRLLAPAPLDTLVADSRLGAALGTAAAAMAIAHGWRAARGKK